jgi:hypothetical protein
MTRPQPVPENLFEAIATLLPAEQREYFYQRMLYFRHLRPEDELLRIAEAMGFLALLIRETPEKLASEREQFAKIVDRGAASIEAAHQTSVQYHQQLEERLKRLPAEVAKGISPEAIAEKINESLRQQFAQSGIPEKAEALAVVSRQLKQATEEFQRTAGQLKTSYTGAADDARRAIDQIRSSIANATENAKRSMADIKQSFLLEYKYSIAALCGSALVIGLILGYLGYMWLYPKPEEIGPMVPATSAAPAKPNSPRLQPSHKKRVQPNGPSQSQ